MIYVSPPQPPSPVPEGSEEGSSPRATENGNLSGAEFSNVSPLVIKLDDELFFILRTQKRDIDCFAVYW